ncbi:MAG: alpha/beta hydrolase [Acidimicrobiales bacterium]
MQLWTDEDDSHRPQMRAAAEAVGDVMNQPQDPGLSVEARVAQQRAIVRAMAPPGSDGVDREIAGVPCRIMTPADTATGVYLHFHGGGMILGEPAMNDADNLELVTRHGLAVVSVDYRLAPEHPYPAGPDDGETVAGWLLDHAAAEFGSDRLLIGGESAGAYMTAATLLRVRDNLGAIDRFLGANLVFGVYDWGRSPSQRGIRPTDAPDLLSPGGIEFFTECYLPGRTDDERRHPLISPAFADLSAMPPALLTVGTADHLLDDTLMLAGRSAAHENTVELHVLPDAPHGFYMFGDTDMARLHHRRTHAWFDQVLAG